MLKNAPLDLKTLVLLQFTRKLVISKNPMVFLIEQEKKTPKTKKEKFIENVKKKIPQNISKPVEINFAKPIMQTQMRAPRPPKTLKIPQPKLPPQFAYLRPQPNKQIQLNLGNLNPMINDPSIKIIQVTGADQPVIVKGKMGTMPTATTLSLQEINSILQEFSKKSKIPIGKGTTKIIIGNLSLSALVSQGTASFTIEKIPLAPPRPARQIKKRPILRR